MHQGVSSWAGRTGRVVAETRPGPAGRSLDWASRLGSARCSVSWAAQAASKSNTGHAAPREASVIMEARLVLLYLYYNYNRAGPITRQVTRQVTRDPLSQEASKSRTGCAADHRSRGRSRDATSQGGFDREAQGKGVTRPPFQTRGRRPAESSPRHLLSSRAKGTPACPSQGGQSNGLSAAEPPTARQQLGPDSRVARH